VEAITTWDLNDGKWLGAPSGLLRKDNSLKPVYHELMARIKGEWWTDEQLVTNETGEVELHGFRGDYTVSSASGTATFTLDGKSPECSLRLGKSKERQNNR
jgi:phage gp46-like protein